jgi:thiazole synthase ThiGH ThiG subunit
VQWVRSRFNEVIEKAEFVRLKLIEGQRRLPPDVNSLIAAARLISSARSYISLSAVTPGLTTTSAVENYVVQWVRSRFNEVIEKAEFVRLKLIEGQRRLPPSPVNSLIAAARLISSARSYISLSAVTPGLTTTSALEAVLEDDGMRSMPGSNIERQSSSQGGEKVVLDPGSSQVPGRTSVSLL